MGKALYYINGIEESPVPVVILKEWEFNGFKVVRYCLVDTDKISEEKDCVENGFTRFVKHE